MKALFLTFTGLLISTLTFADIPCGYFSKRDQSIEYYKSCGKFKGPFKEKFIINNSHMDNIVFDENRLSCIYVASMVFYMDKNGKTRQTVLFDNGCDYFQDGIARGYENEKMVYIDKNLNVVLRPDFEWLSPFDYGHAKVCNGPFEIIKEGEHSLMTKGQCGLIDQKGNLVVEAKYEMVDNEAFDIYINSHNHCPKPPITTEESAICHATRHLHEQEEIKKLKNILSVTKQEGRWLINFTDKDQPEKPFVIELEEATAKWLLIAPAEK